MRLPILAASGIAAPLRGTVGIAVTGPPPSSADHAQPLDRQSRGHDPEIPPGPPDSSGLSRISWQFDRGPLQRAGHFLAASGLFGPLQLQELTAGSARPVTVTCHLRTALT